MSKLLNQYGLLLFVLLVASFLRLYKLAELPSGLTWDEAAIGYNGYAISTTGKDEWLKQLPVSFRSFGDYKAPLAIYVSAAFSYFFGLSPWLVRLPFALSGILAIAVYYFVLQKLLQFVEHKNWYALLGSVLLALSPWHIYFSRVGFESGMALTLLLLGLLFLLWFGGLIERKSKWFYSLGVLLLAEVFFIASLYTYHSSKIVVPIVAVVTFLMFIKINTALKNWWMLLVGLAVAIGGAWPLLSDSLFGSGATRANVLIFSENLTITQYLEVIFQNYIVHLSPAFLFNGLTDILRHGTGEWGVLLFTTYVLSWIGLLGVIWCYVKNRQSPVRTVGLWAVIVILVGLLPATITREVPHTNRSLFAIIGFISLAVTGYFFALEYIKTLLHLKIFNLDKVFIGIFALLHIFLFVGFWNYYTTIYPLRTADSFSEGYLEAMDLAHQYEKGQNGKPTVEKIIFSSEYGQPYIYALFERKTSPYFYNGGSLIKYEFTDRIAEGDLLRKNILIVTTKSNLLPIEKATHVIRAQDGSVRFAFNLSEGQ
jgi:hypothetical protein